MGLAAGGQVDLKEGFRDYLLYELGRRHSTVDQYVERVEITARYFGVPWETLATDPKLLRRLKRERPWAGSTIKGRIVAVHALHLWGSLEGYWPKNGVMDVSTSGPYDDTDDIPPLPVEKARILLDACERPLDYRLIYYGLYLGTRIGESAQIVGEMWEDGWVRFPSEKRRGKREVPIHPELEAKKWRVLESPATDESTLQRVKRRLSKKVGFYFVAHQLRKTWSTMLYDNDVQDRVVKSLMGHAQDVTGRYIEVSRRKKSEAIATLDYFE